MIKEFNKFNKILFNEENHTYEYTGDKQKRMFISATTFLSQFHEKFDSESAAKKKSLKTGIPFEQYLKEWDEAGKNSRYKGTGLHSYMENIWNCKEKIIQLPEGSSEELYSKLYKCIKIGYKFYNDAKNTFIPVKQECIVYDVESMIAGTIDAVFLNNKTLELEIIDWKTNKEITRGNSYGNYLLHPISHLEQCSFYEYALQLSLYRYILEKNTNLKISKLRLVWIFEGNETYEIINLPYLKDEIESLMKIRINTLNGSTDT